MTNRKHLTWLDRVMLLLNIISVISLLLAYASTSISPATFWPLAFFGMAYPLLLAVNFTFVVYWLARKRRFSLFPVIAILLGWGHLNSFVTINSTGKASKNSNALKVMSYNVRLFDLYNWRDNELTRNEIFDLLLVEDADIMCLQEFFNSPERKYFVTKDTIVENFRQQYCHDDYVQKTKHGHEFGIATFSAHPIVNKGRIDFANDRNNICIWSDIKIGSDTIRVYNAHLASIGFQDSDYALVAELDEDNIEKGGKRIGQLLKRAFIKRAKQAETIAEHMTDSPYPIIYCADMNDTPVSYSYNVLSNELNDAFCESATGTGSSYIGDLPSFRIDYIMHSDELNSYGFKTLPDELSDHRPITCFVEW